MGRGYLGIGILFLAGIIGYLAGGWKRKIFSSDRLLHITFLICMVIPCGLSIYYSFYSDYQPQGRYLMPMLIPFLYFVTTGLTLVLEKIPQKSKSYVIRWNLYVFHIDICSKFLLCSCADIDFKKGLDNPRFFLYNVKRTIKTVL